MYLSVYRIFSPYTWSGVSSVELPSGDVTMDEFIVTPGVESQPSVDTGSQWRGGPWTEVPKLRNAERATPDNSPITAPWRKSKIDYHLYSFIIFVLLYMYNRSVIMIIVAVLLAVHEPSDQETPRSVPAQRTFNS